MRTVVLAGDWLADWLERHPLPETVAFAVRLCLEEVLANIVMHGHDAGNHAIGVTLRQEDASLVMLITDDGKPFDPLMPLPPAPAGSLDQIELGGYGQILVRHYADQMAYRRSDGMNCLTLRFTLPGGNPAPGR